MADEDGGRRSVWPKPVIVTPEGKNVEQLMAVLGQVLDRNDAAHLMDRRWSIVSDKGPKKSAVEKLNAKMARAAEARAAVKQEAAQAGVAALAQAGAAVLGAQAGAAAVAPVVEGAGLSADDDVKFVQYAEPPENLFEDLGFAIMSDPLAGVATMTVYYLDPLTDECESEAARKLRISVWMWLTECLVHFDRIILGTLYDVFAVILLLEQSFGGNKKQKAVQGIKDMSNMKLGNGRDAWPTLCGKVTALASVMDTIRSKRFRMPPGILPAFVLSMLDADPQYAVQVARLRERENSHSDLTVGNIVTTMNIRHAQLLTVTGGPSISANVANATGGRGKGKGGRGGKGKGKGGRGSKGGRGAGGVLGECWNFAKGKCDYGNTCKFVHAAQPPDTPVVEWSSTDTPSTQGCYECGSLDHRYSNCDKKGTRDAREQENVDTIRSLRATVDRLSVVNTSDRQGEPGGAINGMRATVNPFAGGGEMETAFLKPGPGKKPN